MDKKEVIFSVGVALVLVLAVLHTLAYMVIYQISGSQIILKVISYVKISSLSINLDSIREMYNPYETTSRIVVGVEWGFIVLVMIVKTLMNRTKKIKSVSLVVQEKIVNNSMTKTDLDVLYNILKERKHVRISDVMKTFNITEEIAMEWGKILEYGNLAEIGYPRIGEPEIILTEK